MRLINRTLPAIPQLIIHGASREPQPGIVDKFAGSIRSVTRDQGRRIVGYAAKTLLSLLVSHLRFYRLRGEHPYFDTARDHARKLDQRLLVTDRKLRTRRPI